MNIYNNTIVASYLDLQGKPVDRTPDRYRYLKPTQTYSCGFDV